MTTIPNGHEEKCTQCGSKAVYVEWDERVNATQVQYLWRCLNCKNEFITQVASDEKPISALKSPSDFLQVWLSSEKF